MPSESKNTHVIWGYMLLGPGRPDKTTQRRVMAHAGVDMGEFGTLWEDTLPARASRPQTQLSDRNILIKGVQAGDVAHFAGLLCLGVSGDDVQWFLSELRERGVTVVIHDGMEELTPESDPGEIIKEFERRRHSLHVQRSRAKKAKTAKKSK